MDDLSMQQTDMCKVHFELDQKQYAILSKVTVKLNGEQIGRVNYKDGLDVTLPKAVLELEMTFDRKNTLTVDLSNRDDVVIHIGMVRKGIWGDPVISSMYEVIHQPAVSTDALSDNKHNVP